MCHNMENKITFEIISDIYNKIELEWNYPFSYFKELYMSKFTFLSNHATVRLEDRTKMTNTEIRDLMDKKLFVVIASLPGLNKRHCLFYSEKDDSCFVIIQDSLAGTVITILPLNYHAKLAYEVKEKDCEKAKKIYFDYKEKPKGKELKIKKLKIKDNLEPKFGLVTIISESTGPTPAFKVVLHLIGDEGKMKVKDLVKIHSKEYSHSVNKLIESPELTKIIDQVCADKNINIERVYGITIKHNRTMIHKYIEIRNPESIR